MRGVSRPYHVLILSDQFRFAYRILRCFHAAGTKVHVLGAKSSSGLRFSRFCATFRKRVNGCRGDLGPLIEEVNSVIAELDVDLVVSGEHFMMRPLIAMAPALNAPCFPMLTIEKFDLLNNKWLFTQLCGSLGIRCPRSQLVVDVSALSGAVKSGEISIPFVAKPLDFDGSRGVLSILQTTDFRKLDSIQYSPILVQEFVNGIDIAASVYCDHGEIKAFIAHSLKRATYFTFKSEEIRAAVEKIVIATKAHGILNFDMRVGPDGSVYCLECNPRFFFWIHMSLLAGIPFVEFGLPNWPVSGSSTLPSGTNVRFFKAAAVELARPWRLTKRDFGYLRYVLADPVPWVRETLGYETDLGVNDVLFTLAQARLRTH
jgi:predicted ATP-grasp superfamily ATP-dependent carboligase